MLIISHSQEYKIGKWITISRIVPATVLSLYHIATFPLLFKINLERLPNLELRFGDFQGF